MKSILATMGRLGATVAGTESVFYWWPSQLSKEKGDSK
jgi:hypothetical protein